MLQKTQRITGRRQACTLTLVIFLWTVMSSYVLPQQKIAGYFPSWAGSPAVSSFEFQNLTHIIYCFASANSDGSISVDSGIPNSAVVTAAHVANVKVLISFGGSGNTNGFPAMSDTTIRTKFISNVFNYLLQNQLDGIDIDWEYPTTRQSGTLTLLVRDLRLKFNTVSKEYADIRSQQLLITLAIPPTGGNAQFYQLESMTPYVDWYNVMDYDFSGSWSSTAQNDAPLYSGYGDQSGSTASSITYMSVTRKVPKSKILLGVPFYGKIFNAAGLYKPFTGSVPEIAYADIMNTVTPSGWTYYFDAVTKSPYYEKNDSTKFITFDDTTSLRIKTEYSIQQQLGGIMIWSIDQDLINNKHPLLSAIAQTMRNYGTLDVKPLTVPARQFALYDNYPNPFNPETKIIFSLEETAHVKLTVYDITGREVAVLANDVFNSGNHSVVFNAKDLASGVYIYTLLNGRQCIAKKMMVLK